MLCRKLGVTRGGYYAWVERGKSQQALSNEALLVEIRRIHTTSDERYGYPRVYAALKREGIPCGRHRVARIMRGVMHRVDRSELSAAKCIAIFLMPLTV